MMVHIGWIPKIILVLGEYCIHWEKIRLSFCIFVKRFVHWTLFNVHVIWPMFTVQSFVYRTNHFYIGHIFLTKIKKRQWVFSQCTSYVWAKALAIAFLIRIYKPTNTKTLDSNGKRIRNVQIIKVENSFILFIALK